MKERYTVTTDGFCGRWFEGTTHKDKVVIVMPGTGTAEENAVKLFGFIHKAGYSVMMIANSKWDKELPSDPIQVPVEYAEKAIAVLKEEGYTRFAMYGISFGARYSLLCATLIPDIEVVMAASPYDYVTEGVKGITNPQNCSSLTYRGQDLPYLPVELLHHNLLAGVCKLLKSRYTFKQIMRFGYDSCTETEEARIRVENITADILLLSPGYDDCWPSDTAVPRMERLIRGSGKCKRFKSVVYEKASHIIGLDLDATPDRKKKMQSMLQAEMNNPQACDEARREGMKEIIDFLDAWE